MAILYGHPQVMRYGNPWGNRIWKTAVQTFELDGRICLRFEFHRAQADSGLGSYLAIGQRPRTVLRVQTSRRVSRRATGSFGKD